MKLASKIELFYKKRNIIHQQGYKNIIKYNFKKVFNNLVKL